MLVLTGPRSGVQHALGGAILLAELDGSPTLLQSTALTLNTLANSF
jgi:hypothetical protein